MSCLCSKLREKSYNEITADEIDLLTRTLREAPQLFSIITDLEPPNKRKRSQNPPNSSSDAALDLVSSYPDKTFQELLANHGEQWLSNPISFLKHWDVQHSDIVVKIYSSINRIEKSDGMTKLLKRVYCYALTELHEKGTKVDDMVSRILNTTMFRAMSKDKITEEIYGIFKVGSKWEQIVRFCGKLCEEDPKKVSAVIWLLGKGYAWERASAKACEQAITKIGPQSALFVEARKYSSSVNTILSHLKKETSFLPSGSHVSPQYPLPLVIQERPLLPTPQSQEHTSSPPSSAHSQNSVIAERLQPTCASRVPPLFPACSDISYGAPVLRISHADMSQSEATPHISPIPPLFHAMGGRIPKILFDRATCPQRRMNEYGKFFDVKPCHTGLHQDIVNLLDPNTLKRSIEHLISLSIITVEDSAYVCEDESSRISFEESKGHWVHQAFRLCCYVFPRSPIVDSSFSSTGKGLLGVLRHLLRLYMETGLEPPHCKDTVETLLAASKLEGLNVKEHLLTMAAKSESSPEQTYLRAEIVCEWSVVYRFKGRVRDSERVIQEFLQRQSLNIWNLPLERLRISEAYNQIYHFNFCGAREALQWNLSSRELSEGETYLLCDQLCCNGRILRGEGRFDEAKKCFKGCLKTVGLPESKRLLITSHLSDLCCELEYVQQSKPSQTTVQTVYLKEGREILQPEIDRIRGSNRHSKGLRRLLLSLIEIEIRQNHLNEAEKLTKEILDMYNRLTEPGIDDKVGHVRALIAWARISPPCEAEERWMAALHQNKTYNPSEDEVFTCGVIYLFISSARLQLGMVEESRVSFNQAIEVISRKKPQFLIPGIGTYLFNSVTSDLWSRAGWSLPKIAS
ncbi:hypothetical protein BCR34DRAFT_667768 [Clohesyomyces aquaticus]|uniref:Uncharacterized protein n=1 Tax=Clohesyomyces aquaticus TaxID=1231657 RepID=A0A1Y1YVS3_9PLEO|nr:hypothetical protein BCR34DRAFT_667768 [Clohesyomyces aquaticus]